MSIFIMQKEGNFQGKQSPGNVVQCGKEVKTMIKFKGCPRCRGDLYLASDIYGRYFNCLQCGFIRDLPQEKTGPAPVQTAAQSMEQEAFPEVLKAA